MGGRRTGLPQPLALPAQPAACADWPILAHLKMSLQKASPTHLFLVGEAGWPDWSSPN